ncbi:MAG: FAD/NAD(P)-binding protein [Micromonosporaceae bacterium]
MSDTDRPGPATGLATAAIVGLGSRGLSILERIVTLAKRAGPEIGELRIAVIDPRCDGAGVHDTGQPDYLLLNTTCAQVSMFPDACTVGDDVDAPGPSLHEWVRQRGLRLGEDGFTVTETGREIRPFDFLPRRLLGEYLGWFLAEVCRRAPSHVRITWHRQAAVDLAPGPHDELSITLADGTQVLAEHAFLTTGYTANADGAPPAGYVAEPYPLPDRLADVAPGQSVAIEGFGLSAMDVMSCLTVGRGGRFLGAGDQLTYVPSGHEPTLLFYSRSGVPCRARPLVVRFAPTYEPLVLTHDAIDRLRESRGGRLDFDRDLLPLVLTELRFAYRRRQAVLDGEAGSDVLRTLASAGTLPRITAVLDELDHRLDRFDPRAALDGGTGMVLGDAAGYQQWLAEVIGWDLAEGRRGFTGSPFKAALDILRELRDTIRYVVDFGGLTEHSLDQFNRWTVPVMNRAVVGPQFERHAELLALLAAGVARAPFGPGPEVTRSTSGRWRITSARLAEPYTEEVDWVAAAHVPLPAVATSASPLLQALYRRGWITPYRPAGPVVGLHVDRDLHPVRADGRSDERVWVIGPLCEGATFYTNLVPSPHTYSRPIFDAHRCAASMIARLLPVPAPALPAVSSTSY